jgi:hypothetical protein
MKKLSFTFFDIDPRYPSNCVSLQRSISKLSPAEINAIERPKNPLPIQRKNLASKILEETTPIEDEYKPIQRVRFQDLPPVEVSVANEERSDLDLMYLNNNLNSPIGSSSLRSTVEPITVSDLNLSSVQPHNDEDINTPYEKLNW